MKSRNLTLKFSDNTSGLKLLDVHQISFELENNKGFILVKATKVIADDCKVIKAWSSVTRAVYDKCSNTIFGIIHADDLDEPDKPDGSKATELNAQAGDDCELQWCFLFNLSVDEFDVILNSQSCDPSFANPRGPRNGGGTIN